MGNSGSQMPYLECGIGLRCNDFVLMMADSKVYQGAPLDLSKSTSVDKINPLEKNTLLMCLGEWGPLFTRHLRSAIDLRRLKSPNASSTCSTAHTVSQIMRNFRHSSLAGHPMGVHIVLGTAEPGLGPTLYRGDPFGALVEVPYAYIGVNGFMTVSILDRYHRRDLTLAEAYDLLIKCVQHMKRRCVFKCSFFCVKVLERSGNVRDLPSLKWADIEID